MKKTNLLILLLLLFFNGCVSTVTSIPPTSIVTGVDFSSYNGSDFLFTPHAYNGKYKSIGLISITLSQGAEYGSHSTSKVDSLGRPISVSDWSITELRTKDAVDTAYKVAQRMGADAIIDFSIENTVEEYNGGTNQHITIRGFKIYGFAIKRED